jgi:hypothetical protein
MTVDDWREMLKAIVARRAPPVTVEDELVKLVRTEVREGRLYGVSEFGPILHQASPALAYAVARALPGIVANNNTTLATGLSTIFAHADVWQRENPTWADDVATSFLTGRLVQVVDALTVSVERFVERRSAVQA